MKTMKKFLSMAALALVGAMMTGCSSDDNFDNPQQPENKSKVVTLTTTVGFDDAAGTTRALSIEGNKGVKTFAAGETMAVIYFNGTSNVKAVSHALEAGDITNEGKNATFIFDLETPQKSGPVLYIYPAAMAGETGVDVTKLNTQEGTFDALQSKYDLCTNFGDWDGDNLPSLTLENLLAILAINLKNGSTDITSTITDLSLSDGTNTYSVTREAAAGPIYVAILPTSGATINVTATDGSKNYTKTLTNKTYAASSGYNVSWRMTEAAIPGVLNGQFSVSDTKQVYFSKGNLQYDGTNWKFAASQWEVLGANGTGANGTAANCPMDLFTWGNIDSPTYNGTTYYTENADLSGIADWGSRMGSGWYTLSKDEWLYLFGMESNNTDKSGHARYRKYFRAQVNGVKGIVLLPDDLSGISDIPAESSRGTASAFNGKTYTTDAWSAMESAGCVFLPAAGFRNGASVGYVGSSGFYWPSTAYDAGKAYTVGFDSDNVFPANNFNRNIGFSVRLVREVPSN